MFDNIPFVNNNKNEVRAQIEAEHRERDFVKGRDFLNIGATEDSYDQASMHMRNNLLKWQQDLEDELEFFKHELRGEVLTIVNGEKVWAALKEPMAKEKFIRMIESQIKPFLSRNLINSNFTEKRILMMLRNTCDDIADLMASNWDTYGIDFCYWDDIIRQTKNIIIASPFRAMNDGQRKHDRSIIKRIEATNESPQKQSTRRGIFT